MKPHFLDAGPLWDGEWYPLFDRHGMRIVHWSIGGASKVFWCPVMLHTSIHLTSATWGESWVHVAWEFRSFVSTTRMSGKKDDANVLKNFYDIPGFLWIKNALSMCIKMHYVISHSPRAMVTKMILITTINDGYNENNNNHPPSTNSHLPSREDLITFVSIPPQPWQPMW